MKRVVTIGGRVRYGIISDIHGNLEALESVIHALKKEKVDQFLCLGDVLGYGADPLSCTEIIRELKPVVIAGNHDWGCIDKLGLDYFNQMAKEAVIWTKEKLTPAYTSWFEPLPLVEKINNIILVHGSLYQPEKFLYVLDYISARASINCLEENQNICLVGHTHLPSIYIEQEGKIQYSSATSITIEPQKRYLINVGSVGQPRDRNPRASYGIYDTETRLLRIERLEYDIEKAQRKIIKAGLPLSLALRLGMGQ